MSRNTSKLHLELLDNDRLTVFDKLSSNFPKFVLGGGTALALQIAHRKSYDLDFFSDKPIDKGLLTKLKDLLDILSIEIDNSDELTILTNQQIKISFIYYPFPSFFERVESVGQYHLFSIKDIATQKVYTIGRRGAYRDYFDLYSILKDNHISFAEIIKNAEKNYGTVFNAKLFVQQVVYFGDIIEFEIVPPTEGADIPPFSAVKMFLSDQVDRYISMWEDEDRRQKSEI